jgi:hypothetical protein
MVTWRALYKRREHQGMRIERNPYCREKPRNWTARPRSVTGWLPEAQPARAEHLVQLPASLAVFVTACLHQGVFMYCAITERDRSVFHGQG